MNHLQNAKVSVIVPVYNVEPYLRKCLDSILAQTYQNLEIILVDDGSTDKSGTICDEYAGRDDRIHVIHKENGGVSSARNAGLTAADGEYIGWVDADDWIEPDMYAYLLSCILRYGADIAICSRKEEYRKRSVFRGWDEERMLNKEEALGLLLENDVLQNFLWDKLWRRDLYRGIVFPEGRTFEDIAVMHRLFERAEGVICLPEAKYHYFQREGSIVNSVSLTNKINYYHASWMRYEEMRERWPQFCPHLEGQCVASMIGIWCSYLRVGRKERKKYQAEMREIAQFSKLHYKSAIEYMGLGKAGRIVVTLTQYTTWWAFALAGLFSWMFRLKHGHALIK